MKNEIAEGPAFSEKFEELILKIENRDIAKRMSDAELRDLRRTIDGEVIRRKVVEHIQILANQLK